MANDQFIELTSTRRLIIIAGALIALAVPATWASAATGSSFGLRVFNGDNPMLARFTSARCGIVKGSFVAVAYQNGYVLYIHLRPFTGFHRYALRRGHATGTFLEIRNPSLEYFASDFIPPYHIPGGGQVNFGDGGRLLGGGFYPMFNENGSEGVGVAGGLTCHYTKQRPRG